MRKLEYLSPTSIMKYMKDQENFYMMYMAENRAPREPQTKPMSIGSSFDAYAKSYLFHHLFGKIDPRFDFNTIFEAQVEPQNRDWAKKAGMYAFEAYKASGALADLVLMLDSAQGEPRFETTVMGAVNGYREGIERRVHEVIFLGKPDLAFINKDGADVILDWKVNGFCSDYAKSPEPGYIRIRDSHVSMESRGNNTCHTNCIAKKHKGTLINCATAMDQVNADWATQLSIYAWVLGRPIGDDFVLAVDQLCCKPSGFEYPWIRVAEHRCLTSTKFQNQVFDTACLLWDINQHGHFFRELSPEDSLKREQTLDQYGVAFEINDSNDAWLANVVKKDSSKKWF